MDRDPGLRFIAYISSATRPLSAPELEALLIDARAFNQSVDVTGVLLYNGSAFFQYFEGAEAACGEVYGRIKRSSRHHSIVELGNSHIAERQFAQWAMAYSKATPSKWLEFSKAQWLAAAARGPDEAHAPPEGVRLLHAFWQAATGEA